MRLTPSLLTCDNERTTQKFLNPGGSIKDRIALQSLSPFQTKQNKNSHTHWIKAVIDWFDDALIHPLTLNIGLNK